MPKYTQHIHNAARMNYNPLFFSYPAELYTMPEEQYVSDRVPKLQMGGAIAVAFMATFCILLLYTGTKSFFIFAVPALLLMVAVRSLMSADETAHWEWTQCNERINNIMESRHLSRDDAVTQLRYGLAYN